MRTQGLKNFIENLWNNSFEKIVLTANNGIGLNLRLKIFVKSFVKSLLHIKQEKSVLTSLHNLNIETNRFVQNSYLIEYLRKNKS